MTKYIVTDEMRTATISVCIACIDARLELDRIIDEYTNGRNDEAGTAH